MAMLEKSLSAHGIDASFLWKSPEDWGDVGPELDAWIDRAAEALGYAIVSASAVIDFEAAVIDGWMPATVRARLVKAVAGALTGINVAGIQVPEAREGTIGINARSLGGASLPLSERFMIGSALPMGA